MCACHKFCIFVCVKGEKKREIGETHTPSYHEFSFDAATAELLLLSKYKSEKFKMFCTRRKMNAILSVLFVQVYIKLFAYQPPSRYVCNKYIYFNPIKYNEQLVYVISRNN